MGKFIIKAMIIMTLALISPSQVEAGGQSATEKRLLEGLKNADGGRGVQNFIRELGNLKKPTKKVVSALRDCLKLKDGYAQMMAVEALGKLGPISKPASRDIGKVLKESLAPNKYGRSQDRTSITCIKALRSIGVGARGAISVLKKSCDSKSSAVRVEAIAALGSVSKGSKKAVKTLQKALSDKDASVRQAACWALFELSDDGLQAQDTLISMAVDEDEDVNVRSAAIAAMGMVLDLKKPKGITELNKLALSKNKSISTSAIIAIGRFRGLASRSTVSLKSLINKDDRLVSTLAKASLMMVNPKEGLPWKDDLIAVIGKEHVYRADRDGIAWSVYGLLHLGKDIQANFGDLRSFMKRHSSDYHFISITLSGLTRMGHLAKELLPSIEKLKDSDDHRIRSRASSSIEAIKKAIKDHASKTGPP